tara:strand:- start:715 stop:1497 length:783 start_codon:yes stop_codon:yes gene_type:complete
MKFFKDFYYITNFKTFLVTFLAISATYLCIENEIHADLPLALVSIAIIFPVVFAINSAYARREQGLVSLAACKGFMHGFYRITADHPKDSDPEKAAECKEKIKTLFNSLKCFLESDPEKSQSFAKDVYVNIKSLSVFSKTLLVQGLHGRSIARMSVFLTRFCVAFEEMQMIFYYRTPIGLKAYGKIFLVVFPVLYAPSFALLASNFSGLAEYFSYLIPTLYAIILVSLDNIQTQLENPFDQFGSDDIRVDIDKIDEMLIL